ncbi:MAG: N-acetylmuramoyl-L-alanine amidase [Candidatus Alcyoniella australis]|nr:N-acetylmuramoyl-L-alanine amidase [Candidatus Alcyoniella australis]
MSPMVGPRSATWLILLVLFLGPTAQASQPGFATLKNSLPPGAAIERVEQLDGDYHIYLSLPQPTIDQLAAELLAQALATSMVDTPAGTACLVFGRGPGVEDFRPLGKLIDPGEPVPQKPFEAHGSKSLPHPGQPQPAGFLSGRSIFLSAGHGWYLHETYGWITQRGNTNGLVEDFLTAETVDQYLARYLYNAGAGVYTTRERDMQTRELVIDNNDEACTLSGPWQCSTTTPGYYGADYCYTPVSLVETALAQFTAELPADGYYHVGLWYNGGANRSTDARVVVGHSGGQTVHTIDQQRDGFTFNNLGRYYFIADDPPERRSVVVSNMGTDAGRYVIADAVRFGGGMGSESQKPRWEESGLYYAPLMGCPECASNTVTSMPRYAKWENEAWEDSIYVSFHTNAPDPGRGTSVFAYSSAGWDGPFDGVAGSLELRAAIHDELIADLRAGWDADWTDRGEHTNWYGEINPNYNDEMPGALLELAFHDTPADAAALKEPAFRELAARSIYQAIVRYFAVRDGIEPHFLPQPPTDLSVTYEGNQDVYIHWQEPSSDNGGIYGDPAEFYTVYVSENGRGFSVAAQVPDEYTSIEPTVDGPLYLRVSATNAGGESFPSETLAVYPGDDHRQVLLVSGFDRLDSGQNVIEPYYGGGEIERMYLEHMNSFDYTIAYAQALAQAGVGFDCASHNALIDGRVDLNHYDALFWILGEESTQDETLSLVEQQLFSRYGPSLFISGSEIGWDLAANGSQADQTFYADYLGASYQADDAGTGSVIDPSFGIFAGIGPFEFDYDQAAIYAADWPDAIDPLPGSDVALLYRDGDHAAAITHEADTYRVVYLAFPLETVLSADVRAELIAAAVDYLVPDLDDDDDASDDDDDDMIDDDDDTGEDDDDDNECCG